MARSRSQRILFVDDEPQLLDGLQRQLRPQRPMWDMVFACGGPAGMLQLETGFFDVIVTDLRMPVVDGATLLRHVQHSSPSTVRIVLSGHSELESVLRIVPVAHQFLTKPSDAVVLKEAIERACNLQALLNDDKLRQVIGRLGSLPSRPQSYESLLLLLDQPLVALDDIARIVERDLAMAAKCLQLVNSAFFGLAQPINSIKRALAYLGLDVLRSLVISAEVFRLFEVDRRLRGMCYDTLPLHSLRVAGVASRLVADRTQAQNAFMAGMLHDIGKLVLATGLAETYVEITDRAKRNQCPVYSVEVDILGFCHAEIGAYLLGLWGLPSPVVEAVAFHHFPPIVSRRSVDVVSAIHLADILVHDVGASPTTAELGPQIDPAYLEALGTLDQLDLWRSIAAEFSAIVKV